MSLYAVLYCRENGIILLSIPPHSSHKVQPLDRCFFQALKTKYSEACNAWLATHPGKVITAYQVPQLFRIAYCPAPTTTKSGNVVMGSTSISNQHAECSEKWKPILAPPSFRPCQCHPSRRNRYPLQRSDRCLNERSPSNDGREAYDLKLLLVHHSRKSWNRKLKSKRKRHPVNARSFSTSLRCL